MHSGQFIEGGGDKSVPTDRNKTLIFLTNKQMIAELVPRVIRMFFLIFLIKLFLYPKVRKSSNFEHYSALLSIERHKSMATKLSQWFHDTS